MMSADRKKLHSDRATSAAEQAKHAICEAMAELAKRPKPDAIYRTIAEKELQAAHEAIVRAIGTLALLGVVDEAAQDREMLAAQESEAA